MIAVRVWRLSRLLDSERLGNTAVSFLLLSLSQLLMAFSSVIASPRLSTTLYVASGVAAALGFYPLHPRESSSGGGEGYHALTPLLFYKILFSLPDVFAGLLGLRVGRSIESGSRLIMMGVAATFMLRGLVTASTVLSPPVGMVAGSLLVVELARAGFTVALLAKYLAGAGSHDA